MTRDRTALGALFAVALVFACTEGDLAQTPSESKTSRSDESKGSASDDRDDVDQEDVEEAEPQEEEEEDSDEVEAPAPPPRKVSDASVAPPKAAEDDEEKDDAPVATPPGRSSGSDAGKAAVDGGAPTATTNPAFDSGSGELQADGQTVIYRIPTGTGRSDWNPKDKPIRVKPGMVLRFIDEDTTAKGDGHWLHTFGQPCPHSARAIGEGYDCKIRTDAPAGIVPSTVEHSPSNFGGRVYIFVVRDGATTPAR